MFKPTKSGARAGFCFRVVVPMQKYEVSGTTTLRQGRVLLQGRGAAHLVLLHRVAVTLEGDVALTGDGRSEAPEALPTTPDDERRVGGDLIRQAEDVAERRKHREGALGHLERPVGP